MSRPVSPTLKRPGLELAWGAATDVGKARRLNEDSYLAHPGAFVIADGMGGHQAGDVASKLTIEAVRELVSDDIPDISLIADVVQRANESVRSHAFESGREGMGSTMVGAFLVRNADEDSVIIVNVGDSRCYSVIDDSLQQITKDHSQVQELVDNGDITAEMAAGHPDRNVVTRAIGIEGVVAGDFFVVPVVARVRLMLCSDGVSNELTDDRIGALLMVNDDPTLTASGLIAAVLEGKAFDNATVIVVDVTRELAPSGATDEAEVTGPRPRAMLDTVVTGPRPSAKTLDSSAIIANVPRVPERANSLHVNEVIDDVPR